MEYRGSVYRPPVEAATFLLPITEGCTHNSCSFCSMFQGVPFRMWTLEEVEAYLIEAAASYGSHRDRVDRMYLVGADPFALSADRLLDRCDLIRAYFPQVEKISMYARVENITHKSDEDLCRLAAAGVDDLYIGVECGLDTVLAYMNKCTTVAQTLDQCQRLNRAGIHHRDLLMLGTAGAGRGLEMAEATAALENAARPTLVGVTTMTAFEGTKLNDDINAGTFLPASEQEMLEEEYHLLECLDLPEAYFWARHPLDAVGVEGRLDPVGKDRMLRALYYGMDRVREGGIARRGRTGTL
jgi:radical SAM superfamily enzyme YgiQ (UPF0313 family)